SLSHEFLHLLCFNFALDGNLLYSLEVVDRVDATADVELERRAIVHCCCKRLDFGFGAFCEIRAAIVELDIAQLGATAAAEGGAKQGKRRSDRSGNDVNDKPQDDSANAKLGTVQGTADR